MWGTRGKGEEKKQSILYPSDMPLYWWPHPTSLLWASVSFSVNEVLGFSTRLSPPQSELLLTKSIQRKM